MVGLACTATARPPAGDHTGAAHHVEVGAGGSVVGLDISPDMIGVAKGLPSTSARVEWQVGDVTALPFPDDSHDVVLCQMGLMFMEDRSAAVRSMGRVLAPGGRLVVNTPGSIQPAFEIMEQAIMEHINPDLGGFVRAVFSMHDPDAVATLIRDAGLRDVSARVSTTPFRLPPPADFLWQYINLTPMAPLVAKAPGAAQSAMERQVVEAWKPFVVDGQTIVDQPMVVATGRK